MKRHISIILFVLCTFCLFAQESLPWSNLRHSSVDPSGHIHLLLNTIMDETISYQLLYSVNGGGWIEADLLSQNPTQKHSLLPYQFGQDLRYRLKAETTYMEESFSFLHPSYLDSNAFPQSIDQYAHIGSDPIGDSLMIYHPSLDITNTYFAATDTKFFTAMTNVSGSFPTFNSLSSYNLYFSMFLNPDSALADSVMYAMIYTFNLAGIISPGLYKVGIDAEMMPTFTRLGNIQSQVSGGILYMACNIADLVNDPSFGEWPNAYNSLSNNAMTMRLTLDAGTMTPNLFIGDYSNPGVLEFIDHRYNVAQNSLPVLSNISINPYPALKTISATYFDADADFPLIAELELDNGSIYSFVNSSFNFSEPVSFVATVPNTELWQNATIRFSDNNSDLVLENIFVTNTDFLSTQAPGISCLMPNPLRQSDNAYLTLGGLSKGPLQIELYNIKGQKVSTIANLTVKAEEIVLPFGTNVTSGYLSPGMYILRITQTDRTLNKKIIITR